MIVKVAFLIRLEIIVNNNNNNNRIDVD